MTISNGKKAEVWTQNHVINPIKLTLKSKVNVVSGSWMYLTHPLMVIDPCAKYGKPMSNENNYRPDKKQDCTRHIVSNSNPKVLGRTRICTDRQTDGQTEWINIYLPPDLKANRSYRSYMKTWQKPINLTKGRRSTSNLGCTCLIFSGW